MVSHRGSLTDFPETVKIPLNIVENEVYFNSLKEENREKAHNFMKRLINNAIKVIIKFNFHAK